MNTRGVVFIHACPQALLLHAEWALSSALRTPVRLPWVNQPAEPSRQRAECQWSGPAGTANAIANAMKSWPTIVFEVIEEGTAAGEGERICYVPGDGFHRTAISASGDILISENSLRQVQRAARTLDELQAGIDALLGQSFDDALEVYREGGDGAPAAMIHRAG
ncbi:MAG: DUF3145 family protein [Antricoccus sp.]